MRANFYVLPLPCSTSLVSPGKELVLKSGALIWGIAAQRMPFDCLSLVASEAHIYLFHKTIITTKALLNKRSSRTQCRSGRLKHPFFP